MRHVLVVFWFGLAGPSARATVPLRLRERVNYTPLDPATDDKLYVNDPGFDRASYSFSSDVVGWRLYDRAPLEAPRVHGRPS